MTVIAWDGKTLAADKRAIQNGYPATATKIHRIPDGLVAFSGSASHAAALLDWFRKGRNPLSYPLGFGEDNGAGSTFISDAGEIFVYDYRSGYPERIEDRFFARGAGRDYALAAMYLGHDARKAVEVACALDVNCGNGIDTLELEP